MLVGGNFTVTCLPSMWQPGTPGIIERASKMPRVALATSVYHLQGPLCPRSVFEQDSDSDLDQGLQPQGCSKATAGQQQGQAPRDPTQPMVPVPSPLLASRREEGEHSPPLASSGRNATHLLRPANRVDRAQPTPGGRRGPRPPGVALSARPCCGGRCRGRCGSFSPTPRPSSPRKQLASGAGHLEDRSLEVAAAPAFPACRSRNCSCLPRAFPGGT